MNTWMDQCDRGEFNKCPPSNAFLNQIKENFKYNVAYKNQRICAHLFLNPFLAAINRNQAIM